ncbi:MAG: lipopolysaccharide biosynthesis protein [Candidatus Binataceae bacterium]
MRVRRSIWTFLSGEVSTLIVLLVAVFATPLLLRWLGDERYGAVEAATDWLAYVSLLEFGIGGALLPLMARALGRRDESQAGTLLVAGIRAYLIVTILMVLAGLILVAVIPELLPVGPSLTNDLRIGCAVGVITIGFVPLTPLRILLEADQRGYLIHAALLLQSLMITTVSLILAWAKWGITGQFVAILLGILVFNAVVLQQGLRRFPGVRGSVTGSVKETAEWKEIWNLNWPSFAFNLCGRVGLLTDNILIGGLMSPALVVPFFVTQRLATMTQHELQGVGNASWAALAELQVQGNTDIFNLRLIELTRLIAILAAASLIPIVIYNHNFVALWVGNKRFGGDALSIIVALNAFLQAIFSLWAWCINGTGRVRMIMPGLIAQTVINFSLSIVLTLKLGLIGPVLGTLAGFVSISIWYLPMLLHRCFATSQMELFKASALPIVSAVPFAAAVWWMSRAFPVTGWFDMALEMSLAALAYLSLWWMVGLSAGEKELWLSRVRGLVPGNSY